MDFIDFEIPSSYNNTNGTTNGCDRDISVISFLVGVLLSVMTILIYKDYQKAARRTREKARAFQRNRDI
jgi:hypothetical protein